MTVKPEEFKQRANVLTDADLEKLRDMLAEHPCKYPFTADQAQILVGVANNIQTAQNITLKLVITAIIATAIGWTCKGAIQWLVTLIKTGGVVGTK